MLCKTCNKNEAHPVYGEHCEDCFASGFQGRHGSYESLLPASERVGRASVSFYDAMGLVAGPISRKGSDLFEKDESLHSD